MSEKCNFESSYYESFSNYWGRSYRYIQIINDGTSEAVQCLSSIKCSILHILFPCSGRIERGEIELCHFSDRIKKQSFSQQQRKVLIIEPRGASCRRNIVKGSKYEAGIVCILWRNAVEIAIPVSGFGICLKTPLRWGKCRASQCMLCVRKTAIKIPLHFDNILRLKVMSQDGRKCYPSPVQGVLSCIPHSWI